MAFAWNNNVPNPPNAPAVDVFDMLANTKTLNAVFAIDHVNYSGGANQGYHNYVTLAALQSGNPSLTYPVSRIFSKEFGTAPNINAELWYAAPRQTNAQLNNIILTAKAAVQFSATGANGAQTIVSTNTLSANVSGVSASSSVFTVTFSSALDYNTYNVIQTNIDITKTISNLVRNTSGFSFLGTNSAGFTYSFLVV